MSDTPSKPREWFIHPSGRSEPYDGDASVYTEYFWSGVDQGFIFHAIEHSALVAAQAEIERLKQIERDLQHEMRMQAVLLRNAKAEIEEQCRLNGMGAQRELKLMTEIDQLTTDPATRTYELSSANAAVSRRNARNLELKAEIERLNQVITTNLITAGTEVIQLKAELERANQELEQLAKQNFQEMMKTGLYEAESENERLKLLAVVESAKLAKCEKALKTIANDLDQIGVTPTEINHLAIARAALSQGEKE